MPLLTRRPRPAPVPDVHPPDGLDLDDLPLAPDPEDVPALSSNLDWDGNRPWGRPITHAAPPTVFRVLRRTPLARIVTLVGALVHAVRLLGASRRSGAVVVIDMGGPEALLFGLLRATVWRTRGRVLGFG